VLAFVSYTNVSISQTDGPTESLSFNFEKILIDYQK